VYAGTYPPGPSAPATLQSAWWLTRPVSYLSACRRRFGGTFSLRLIGLDHPMVMLTDPETIRTLYRDPRHAPPQGRRVTLGPVMGPRSLLLLEGEEHLARRRILAPLLHGKQLRAYEALMREVAATEVESWPEGRPFAIHEHLHDIALEVILRTIFGVGNPARRAQLKQRMEGLLAEYASPLRQLPALFPWAPQLGRGDAALRRANGALESILACEIAERRSDPALPERGDILSALMRARLDDGRAMSDHELRDHLVTLLLAGHETTAAALAWTFDLLLRHPAALARATEEALQQAGSDYLHAVVLEALRLRPAVQTAGRRLTGEAHLGGHCIPAGTDVLPAVWLAHTRASSFPDPLAFRPERFLGSPPSTYEWIPFGGGTRRCIGAAFAELQMRVVLASALRSWCLHPATSHAEAPKRRNLTVAPRNGTRVVARRRRGIAQSL
jgi:cytochrome P450